MKMKRRKPEAAPPGFRQPWTPYLSFPRSEVFLDESGVGLPCVCVRTNSPWMARLRAPGIIADYSRDPGHSGWVQNPFQPWAPDPGEEKVLLLNRVFTPASIRSLYRWKGYELTCDYGVLLNLVVCRVQIDRPLKRSLRLTAKTLGRATISALDNGIEVHEHEVDYRPISYRIVTSAQGARGQLPVKFETGGRAFTRASSDASHLGKPIIYSVVIPAGTESFEILLNYSRDGSASDERLFSPETVNRSPRNPLQRSACGMFWEDQFFQAGSKDNLASKYLSLLKKIWSGWQQADITATLPDAPAQAFLHYAQIAQRMNECVGDGLIPYPWLMAKHFFWGFWEWDFAFNAISTSWLGDRGMLAKGSLFNLASLQCPDGSIPNSAVPWGLTVFDEDGSSLPRVHPMQLGPEHRSSCQPPAYGYALWRYYQVTGDLETVRHLLPSVDAYHAWYSKAAGSTRFSGLIASALWQDTAQDNSKRWGEQVLNLLGDARPRNWSLPVVAVDINVLWILQMDALRAMHALVAKDVAAKTYEQAARSARSQLDACCWNEEAGFYFDVEEKTGAQIPVFTPAGFFPLAVEIPTADRYLRLKRHLLDEGKFWTRFPLPTLAADDPDFRAENSYWMGTVWFFHNHFVAEGLFKYDRLTAEHLVRKTLELVTHRGFVTAFENYNPANGDGYNAANFTWSGLFVDTLLTHFCGIRPSGDCLIFDVSEIPAEWPTFRLKGLPLLGTQLTVEFTRAASRPWKVKNTGHRSIEISFAGRRIQLGVRKRLQF